MKLETDILPRKEGTVSLTIDGQRYVFEGSPLSCDVQDEHAQKLLATGNFYPASEADNEGAAALLVHRKQQSDADEGADYDDEMEDELEGFAGLPVEANTPPKPKPARAKKK